MTIYKIPTSTSLSYYEMEVVLDGVSYKLEFKYNTRDEAWYLNILDPSDTILRSGIKVVNDWGLLIRWQDVDTRPQGEMIAVPNGKTSLPATLTELGEKVILTYLDSDEPNII